MADTCPKCGQTGISSDKCPGCGVVVPLYERYLEKVRRGPQRAAAAPAARASAEVVSVARPTVSAAPAWTAPAGRPAVAAPAGVGRRIQPVFQGTGGQLWSVQIVATLLTLITFGIYYPWAKTRIRQYMYAQTEFDGDRLAYHGTGQELFHGAFKASLIFGVPLTVLNLIGQLAGGVVSTVADLLAVVVTAVFLPLAIAGARRYRLSRTSWRGIRFSFRGHTKLFIKHFLGWLGLTVVTLGLYYPILVARRHAFLTQHSYFGNARFGFDGDPRALFRPFLRVVLVAALGVAGVAALGLAGLVPLAALWLALAGLGVALAWTAFVAEKRRYFWSHTIVANARFRSSITAAALTRLWAGNILLLVVTLGLASAWVRVRSARFAGDNLALQGDVDPAAIVQDARDAPSTGEALSSLLDADIEIG